MENEPPGIGLARLDPGFDRVIAGPQKRTRIMSAKERKITAYHEGGHALVAAALNHTDPVTKVTILPRGRALGYTMVMPIDDKYSTTRNELLDQLDAAPAAVLFPCARGNGLYGTWKGFRDASEWGWSDRMPAMVACQPAAQSDAAPQDQGQGQGSGQGRGETSGQGSFFNGHDAVKAQRQMFIDMRELTTNALGYQIRDINLGPDIAYIDADQAAKDVVNG